MWWDDPVHEKSGEYDVHAVDYAQNIVKIGNGEETVELPSEQLEITCPVSEEDRLQLDKLEQHYHMLGKDALELMREIVSQCSRLIRHTFFTRQSTQYHRRSNGLWYSVHRVQ